MRPADYKKFFYSRISFNKINHIIDLLFVWNCKCYFNFFNLRKVYFDLIENSFESLVVMAAVYNYILSYALYSFKAAGLLKFLKISIEIIGYLKVINFWIDFEKFFNYFVIYFTKSFQRLNLNNLTVHNFSPFKDWFSFQTCRPYYTGNLLFYDSRFFMSNFI